MLGTKRQSVSEKKVRIMPPSKSPEQPRHRLSCPLLCSDLTLISAHYPIAAGIHRGRSWWCCFGKCCCPLNSIIDAGGYCSRRVGSSDNSDVTECPPPLLLGRCLGVCGWLGSSFEVLVPWGVVISPTGAMPSPLPPSVGR